MQQYTEDKPGRIPCKMVTVSVKEVGSVNDRRFASSFQNCSKKRILCQETFFMVWHLLWL